MNHPYTNPYPPVPNAGVPQPGLPSSTVYTLAVVVTALSCMGQLLDLLGQLEYVQDMESSGTAVFILRMVCLLIAASAVLLMILRLPAGAFLFAGSVVLLVLAVIGEAVTSVSPAEYLEFVVRGDGWRTGFTLAVLFAVTGGVLALLPPSLHWMRSSTSVTAVR